MKGTESTNNVRLIMCEGERVSSRCMMRGTGAGGSEWS